jgi:hypothetical protein
MAAKNENFFKVPTPKFNGAFDEHSISCWLNILLASSLIQQ